MNNYMLPSDDDFIETIAKAIARDRLYRESEHAIAELVNRSNIDNETIDVTFNTVFENLWAGTSTNDINQKNNYRADARAAISAINLELLIKTT